jgi:hypothetical protein
VITPEDDFRGDFYDGDPMGYCEAIIPKGIRWILRVFVLNIES